MMIKASDRLKSAVLWEGSGLDLRNRHNILHREDIERKIFDLERCDDRTPRENELLRLLKLEIVA